MTFLKVGFLSLVLGAVVATGGCKGDDGLPGPSADGEPGQDGDKGDPGSSVAGEASISGVSPLRVFTNRITELTISGYGTEWDNDVVVEMGDGIDVVGTLVTSPTSIVATVEVARDAELGARTVSVSDGSDGVSFGGGAFAVESPIAFHILGSETLPQGTVSRGFITMRDPSTPFLQVNQFDGRVVRDGEPVGTSLAFLNVTPYAAEVELRTDVDATTGLADIEIDEPGISIFSGITDTLPGAVEIAANTPIVLNQPSDTHAFGPEESKLFQFSVSGTAEVTIDLASADPEAEPQMMVMPAPGKFENAIPFEGFWHTLSARFAVEEAGDYFVIIRNAQSSLTEPADIDINITEAVVVVTPITPAPGPPLVIQGAISAPGELQAYTFGVGFPSFINVGIDNGMTSTCDSDLDSYLEFIVDQQFLLGDNDDYNFLCSAGGFEAFPGAEFAIVIQSAPKCGGCTFDYTLYVEQIPL